MTEMQLLEQLNVTFDSLITSTTNIIVAQSTRSAIRVNTGRTILSFTKEIFQFKTKYSLMSLNQIARNRKMIEEIKLLSNNGLLTVIPKEWGYRFVIYKGLKKFKTYDLQLYVTRSPIICWLYLIKVFFKR